jgi:hypothetical protein
MLEIEFKPYFSHVFIYTHPFKMISFLQKEDIETHYLIPHLFNHLNSSTSRNFTLDTKNYVCHSTQFINHF